MEIQKTAIDEQTKEIELQETLIKEQQEQVESANKDSKTYKSISGILSVLLIIILL